MSQPFVCPMLVFKHCAGGFGVEGPGIVPFCPHMAFRFLHEWQVFGALYLAADVARLNAHLAGFCWRLPRGAEKGSGSFRREVRALAAWYQLFWVC